jgi:serine/threonine protein kinase
MEEFSAHPRFIIQRRLGAGSFGVVYEAYDRQRDSPVAIKTLSHADASSLYRFKREFRALAGISHPNLVTLYELMSSGGAWFFTMELIDGVSFLDYVRQDGGNAGRRADATATLTLDDPIGVAEAAASVMRPRNALPSSRVHFEA